MQSLNDVFAENLRARRKSLGKSQKELAALIGYSEKAVSKWESGGAIPPGAVLVALADALQISIDALFSCREKPRYLLGIDGGATKTDFLLRDLQSGEERSERLGSCNPVDLGLSAAEAVLEEGIRKVCREAAYREVVLFAGISGASSYQEEFRSFLSPFHFAAFEVGSDAQSVVAAGLNTDDGIAVIMGTGSVAFVQKDQKTFRIGGLGYLFDNGGNGYSIGRDVLRAAMIAEDGSGIPTMLHDPVCEKLGVSAVIPSISVCYQLGKRGIASFAPLCIQYAKEGDCAAQEILSRNMSEIAALLETGRRKLGAKTPVRAVFVGGLTEEQAILFPLIRSHLSCAGAFQMQVYEDKPVKGALLLAERLWKREWNEYE